MKRPDFTKRAFDLLVGGLAFVVLLPVMMLIAWAIWISDGGPVLFIQTRPGLDGQPFRMVKFRTMRALRNGPDSPNLPGADAVSAVATDGARITRLGQFLRATSLDELPELLNVLRGEMSLVGPRPLLMEYLPLYSEVQARRHDARPGITGWAQVSGRNNLSWEQQFELDVWYVEHQSLGLDLAILARTVGRVLRREDITQTGQATREPFRGNSAP